MYKSYKIFVGRMYRCIFWAIVFGVGILGQILASVFFKMNINIWVGAFYGWISIIMDEYSFGGIWSKDYGDISFLKGSRKGENTIRAALIADSLYRYISSVVLLLVNELIYRGIVKGEETFDEMVRNIFFSVLAISLIGHLLTTTALIITRHFLVAVVILVTMALSCEIVFAYVTKWIFELPLISFIGVLFVDVLLNVYMIYGIWKKRRESYYDGAVEN